eukprot:SAG11_NODE_17_length_26125_cov_45.892723_6_plen_420_part_00
MTHEHIIYRLKETDHIDQASSQKFDAIACGIRDEGHALYEEKKEQRHQLQRLQQAQQALESQIAYSVGKLQTAKAVRTATVAKILTEVKKAVQDINDRCELQIATDWDSCRAASEELIEQSREIVGDDQHTLALLHVQRVHLPGDQLALQATHNFSPEYGHKQAEPQPPPPATRSELTGAVDAAIADVGIPLGDEALDAEIDKFYSRGDEATLVEEKGGSDAPTLKTEPAPPLAAAQQAEPTAEPASPPAAAQQAKPTAEPAPPTTKQPPAEQTKPTPPHTVPLLVRLNAQGQPDGEQGRAPTPHPRHADRRKSLTPCKIAPPRDLSNKVRQAQFARRAKRARELLRQRAEESDSSDYDSDSSSDTDELKEPRTWQAQTKHTSVRRRLSKWDQPPKSVAILAYHGVEAQDLPAGATDYL